MKKEFAALILGSMLLYWGCATIMHGTSQQIGFSSAPTGAKVSVDGNSIGVTPIFSKLSRGSSHIIKIQLEGYLPYEMTVTKKTSGWVWGNIVFGGLIGLVVDAATGGLYDLNPEQIYAELKKNGSTYLMKDNTIIIATVLNPDSNWEKIDTLIKNK